MLKGYDDIDFLAENGLNDADLDKIGVDGPPGLRKKLLGKWKISEYATGADEAIPYGLRIGTCTQRKELKPSREKWKLSALPWLPDLGTPADAIRDQG